MENSENVSIINILQNINPVLVYTILGIIAALFIVAIVLLIIVLVNQSRLTKKYNAFVFKVEPDIKSSDEEFRNVVTKFGYKIIPKHKLH